MLCRRNTEQQAGPGGSPSCIKPYTAWHRRFFSQTVNCVAGHEDVTVFLCGLACIDPGGEARGTSANATTYSKNKILDLIQYLVLSHDDTASHDIVADIYK